jgi:hypothetical protein
MMSSTEKPGAFGPWVQSLDAAELKARWRVMAVLAMVHLGGRHPLLRCCLKAEHDEEAALLAWAALSSLDALPRRRLLCAYAALDALIHELRVSSSPR